MCPPCLRVKKMNWIGGSVLSPCDGVLQRTDTPPLTQKLHSGRSGESKILHQLKLSTHMDNCVMYVYTIQASWNSNPNTMKHDQPQHDYIHHLCCHPAIFLCWLHLSTLSFPKVKIQCTAKMLLLQFFHFVQNFAGLELHNLK